MWCFDFTQVLITRELRLTRKTVIDKKLHHFLREVCEQYLEENPQQLGGLDENGEPTVVEIEESKYFHRKYYRAQWRQGHCVFGAIERHSGCCCLVEVPDRQRETLL